MTTGPDNLGNGAAKTEDRFAGQLGYRPRANRDGGTPPASPLGGPMNGNGNGVSNGLGGGLNSGLNGGPLGGARNSHPLDASPLDSDDFTPRNGGTVLDRMTNPLDVANPIASTLTQPKLAEPERLREPTLGDVGYQVDSWLDSPVGRAVVDHPLLRGLLLELPPKGATLQAQWLDRWFEAARSILELLYRFEDPRD